MRIAIMFVLSLLVGCSTLVSPDTGRLGGDAGVPMGDVLVLPGEDAGTPEADAWVDPGTDAGVPSDRDAGATCATLPLGPVVIPVTASTCEGPFILAQAFVGTVEGTVGNCLVRQARLRVICNAMYQDLGMTVGTLLRTGTVYTSPDSVIGCEGVEYMCHLVVNATTGEHRIDCSLDSGVSWCSITLE